MKRRSLRLRLIAGGLLAILIALAISGGGLVLLFERHLSRTLAQDLVVHLNQLIAGVDVDPGGGLVMTQAPADPRFAEPLSGLYWQVSDDRGHILRSRSLWDTTLALPADEPGEAEVHQHGIAGPGGARLIVAERRVNLTIDGRRVPVRIAVATDLSRVSTAASAFARDLAIALAMLGLALAGATTLQVTLGLRPLDRLRRGVADIREGRGQRLPAEAPIEVQPLVEEVNALIAAQEEEIGRSRGRAADLAHGLKTPLAALAADAARLREQGQGRMADDIEAVGEAMSRRVDRELARARVRAGGAGASCELAPLVRSLVATLGRTPQGARVVFEPRVPERLMVPIDRTDLAEVLGNLLENAARHAAGLVRIAAGPGAGGARIVIEDDGEGIPEAQWPRALERGGRLDQRGEAGLGLAIVQDVLAAYGWRLELGASHLGGLKATLGPDDERGWRGVIAEGRPSLVARWRCPRRP